MKRVRTQAEVCEFYWKPVDQRTFVSRMIKKWLVVKEQWGYTIKDEVWADSVTSVTGVTKESVTKCNNDKINELEKELDMYKECYNKNAEDYNKLLSDFEFINKEYEKLEKKNISALNKCYQRFVQRKLIDPNEEPFEEFFRVLME